MKKNGWVFASVTAWAGAVIVSAAAAGESPRGGVPGQGLAGHWQGSLKPTPVTELRLALELTNSATGQLGGALISVDQGNARIPLTALTEREGHGRGLC
jgi:hypothetical protein